MKHFKLVLGTLALLAGNLNAAAIHRAARMGSIALVQRQLNKGVSASLADDDGNTPLHYTSSAKVAKLLLGKGANASAKNNEGLTPLHMVPLRLSLKEPITGNLAETLIRGGADVNATDDGGNTPLHDAARFGRVKMIGLLLKHGADPDAQNNEGVTPLHASVALIQTTPTAMVRNAALGISGAATAGTSYYLVSRTLTSMSAKSTVLRAQATLAEAKAAQAARTATAHHRIPIIERQIAAIKQRPFLRGIDRGARLSVLESELSIAKGEAGYARIGPGKEVREARRGVFAAKDEAVGIMKQSPKLSTAFLLATTILTAIIMTIVTVDTIKRHRTVQKLIEGGANVNAKDIDGNTPLHLMAAGRRFKFGERKLGIIAAHMLLDTGANPNTKNKAGLTPYQIARRNYRLILAAVLKPSAAAKRQKRRAWVKEKAGELKERYVQ